MPLTSMSCCCRICWNTVLRIGNDKRSFLPRFWRLLNPSSSSRRSIKSITRDSGIPSSSKVCGTLGEKVRKSCMFETGKADIVYKPSHSAYRRYPDASLEPSAPQDSTVEHVGASSLSSEAISNHRIGRDRFDLGLLCG